MSTDNSKRVQDTPGPNLSLLSRLELLDQRAALLAACRLYERARSEFGSKAIAWAEVDAVVRAAIAKATATGA